MQANLNYKSAIDYIFGAIDTIGDQTYEALPNKKLFKESIHIPVQVESKKKLPVTRQRLKEKSRLLPTKAIDLMTVWYDKNYNSPYPTPYECEQMALSGGISINQVKQWFVNVRRRTQNKNRITREHPTACRKVSNTLKTNEDYFERPNELKGTTPQYSNQTIAKELDPPTTHINDSYANFSPISYQSSPSYQFEFPVNYSISPMYSNYYTNYTPSNQSFSTPGVSLSNQSPYVNANRRFGDSYNTFSPNISLDYSNNTPSYF